MYSKENPGTEVTGEINDCSGCEACIVGVVQEAREAGGNSSQMGKTPGVYGQASGNTRI